jgi:DNA-binding Lrp family transcriptional regulator
LEQAGVIEGYQATLSRQAFNLNVLVYAFVRLSANSDKLADQFEQTVANLDQVLECSVVTGAYDYLLKIIAEDLENYESFVKKSLGRIDYIATIESTVVLKQTFSRNVLPIKM